MISISLADLLKDIIHRHPHQTLEIGVGRGAFAKIIKKAFPKTQYFGFERNSLFTDKIYPEAKIQQQICFKDIKELSQQEQRFDLITMASASNVSFYWMFNIQDEQDFTDTLLTMQNLSTDHGQFLFVFKSQEFENLAEENYVRSQNFILSEAQQKRIEFIEMDPAKILRKLFSPHLGFQIKNYFLPFEPNHFSMINCENELKNKFPQCMSEENLEIAQQLDHNTQLYGQNLGKLQIMLISKI